MASKLIERSEQRRLQKRASAARVRARVLVQGAHAAVAAAQPLAQLRFVALAQPSMSVRVTAAARVPVVAATPVERKVDAPPIDAPPMLVDLDEVVRLRKENAALQADLAVKADLLDTRWTRT